MTQGGALFLNSVEPSSITQAIIHPSPHSAVLTEAGMSARALQETRV
jgi:hypothetical protein